mgnify:CR=1 FL=1
MTSKEERTFELSKELLKGSIDIHVHAVPHLRSSPRRVDPFQASKQARDAGMQAIVLMDVIQMTNGISWLVNRLIPDFKTYGGLIMNTIYGGMNPRAIKNAIRYGDGAKFISFGAHSTYFQASQEGRVINGKFKALSEEYPKFIEEELSRCIKIPINEEPGSELKEILELIGNNQQIYLNTGHVSAEEAIRLVELAEEYGIKKTLVASVPARLSTTEQLRYMVNKGAFIEFTLEAYTHAGSIPKTHYYSEIEYSSSGMKHGEKSGIDSAAKQIKEIGVSHCIICTDFGADTLPEPVEGLRMFIASLLDLGISPKDIKKLVKTNPEQLLGI